MPTPLFLTVQDLYSCVPAARINGYFDDSGNGQISEPNELDALNRALCMAESLVFSRLLRGWGGNPSDALSSIRLLIQNDPINLQWAAWVGCEVSSWRRTEFTDSNGKGPFSVQYDRALDHFESLSKGLIRSLGEATAGVGANTGGGGPYPSAAMQAGADFIFAPSRNAPFGRGGF